MRLAVPRADTVLASRAQAFGDDLDQHNHKREHPQLLQPGLPSSNQACRGGGTNMLGTYFVTSEGGVLWLCDSHRTQKAIGFDAAARCPACTSTTNAIRSLAELSTCKKCRSPLVSIMHLAEGCEFACQRCGHSRLLNPCPLQLLARAMVSQDDLILEPSDGE